MDDQLMRRLIAGMKCGVCGQRYESSNISVLGHRESLWFLNVFCSHCRSYGLIAAVIRGGKAVEVVTDLSEEEYARFSQGSRVGADDVLDIHDFLKSFNGDFIRLFSKR